MNTFLWCGIIKEVRLNVRKRKYNFFAHQNHTNKSSRITVYWWSRVLPCRRIPASHTTCRPVHGLRHSSDPGKLPWHSCFAACLANFYSQHMWRLSAPLRQQGKNRRRPTGMAAQLDKPTAVEKNKKKQQLSHSPRQGPVMEGLSNAFLAEKDRSCT